MWISKPCFDSKLESHTSQTLFFIWGFFFSWTASVCDSRSHWDGKVSLQELHLNAILLSWIISMCPFRAFVSGISSDGKIECTTSFSRFTLIFGIWIAWIFATVLLTNCVSSISVGNNSSFRVSIVYRFSFNGM